MSDLEQLLGRATPHGIRYDGALGVGGGARGMSAAEVGRLLAGLDEGPMRVLLLKFMAGAPSDFRKLVDVLMKDTGIRAVEWTKRAGQAASCRAAAHEFIHARRCGACQGTRTRMVANRPVPCEFCRATGYHQASATQRAEWLGLPRKTFADGPAERFYWARYQRLLGWEIAGIAEVERQARGRG